MRAIADSTVYFIRDGLCNVKIGTTTDIDARLRNLQGSCSTKLTLIRLIDGGQKTEKWLHRKFASLRIGKTEWFQFTREMLSIMPPDEIPVAREIPGWDVPAQINAAYDANEITAEQRHRLLADHKARSDKRIAELMSSPDPYATFGKLLEEPL